MLLTDSEGRARWPWVQPTVRQRVRHARRAAAMLGLGLPLAAALALGGCSEVPNQVNPVSWWHDMEGGEIAKYRPPPPNPNAPFPKIGNQPTRPAGMPDWEWNQLSATLAEQRAAAQTYAAQNPIPTLPGAPAPQPDVAPATPPRQAVPIPAPSPAPTPPPAAAATPDADSDAAEIARLAAAPGPNGAPTPGPSAAALATATANANGTGNANGNAGGANGSALTFQGPDTPATANGPRSVPISGVAPGTPSPGSSSPGGAEAGTKISYFDPNNGLSIPGALGPVAQPDEAHPPALPSSVPVPPAEPGFAIPTIPSTYAPPVAVPAPAPFAPPAPLPAVPPVPVHFAPRSAVLTPPMQKALVNFVQASNGAHIAVTGFGDAPDSAIAAQAAAMPLALERARAITVQLLASGVPPANVRTGARALGSGGLARLVN
jgi:outer membrane protein OmpA-like peptidoglycan-associated protein